MATIDLSKLAAIPYFDLKNLAGRTISSLTFHDAGEWHMWVNAGDQLIKMQGFPSEAAYFAKEAADPNDFCSHFLDFMAQQACFPEVTRAVFGIHDDIYNLSASLSKIEHIHATRAAIGRGCHRMVSAEIEYIFTVCRSIFDLLHEVARKLWDFVHLLDTTVTKKPLKKKFSEMFSYNGESATLESFHVRFGMPVSLAQFYLTWKDFFFSLREFRDNITHNGSTIQTIFEGDTGFLIAKALKPFHDLDIWWDDEREPNDILPLMPALGVVIYRTLAACEEFSRIFSSIVKFPTPVAPGMHFFLRGYFNRQLNQALNDAVERLQALQAEKDAASGADSLPNQ